jgi:hypothetical protein
LIDLLEVPALSALAVFAMALYFEKGFSFQRPRTVDVKRFTKWGGRLFVGHNAKVKYVALFLLWADFNALPFSQSMVSSVVIVGIAVLLFVFYSIAFSWRFIWRKDRV